MANLFQNNKYNPIFWAEEALEHLRDSLGMSRRVYWGYANERQTEGAQKGDTITITVPGLLTATNDENRTPEDLNTGSRNIMLNTYTKSDFAVTDRELSYGSDAIVQDHIGEAMFRVVEDIDTKLIDLTKRIPYRIAADNDVANDLVNGKTALFDNGVRVDREMIHFGIDSTAYNALLKSGIYSSANIAGSNANAALIKGSLDERFGITPFPMQRAAVTHTTGTIATQGSAQVGALVAAQTTNDTTVAVDGLTAGLTIKSGDPFTIAGNSQKYVVTADALVDVGGAVTLSVWPNLVIAYEEDAAVTFDETPVAGGTYQGLAMFNDKAFALVPVALPTAGAEIGSVRMYTAVDEETGMAVRATISYNPNGIGKVTVKYDALFGCDLIDPNRAVQVCRAVV